MKKFLALALSLVMLLTLAACGAKPAENDGAMKSFSVTVVHADGTEKVFAYESAETNVGPVLEAAGLIKGNAGPYGMEITEVDGETAIYSTDGAYWAVYVGEEYAMSGIDTTPITDGGVYKLVYTRG
ncbi:MAG: hypothetical protein IKU07_01255 [Oscillospiraceae bacterium]|nr:hypothetical protein [Oscillospiraceae bacterium]